MKIKDSEKKLFIRITKRLASYLAYQTYLFHEEDEKITKSTLRDINLHLNLVDLALNGDEDLEKPLTEIALVVLELAGTRGHILPELVNSLAESQAQEPPLGYFPAIKSNSPLSSKETIAFKRTFRKMARALTEPGGNRLTLESALIECRRAVQGAFWTIEAGYPIVVDKHIGKQIYAFEAIIAHLFAHIMIIARLGQVDLAQAIVDNLTIGKG